VGMSGCCEKPNIAGSTAQPNARDMSALRRSRHNSYNGGHSRLRMYKTAGTPDRVRRTGQKRRQNGCAPFRLFGRGLRRRLHGRGLLGCLAARFFEVELGVGGSKKFFVRRTVGRRCNGDADACG